ncbi:MAG: ubiquinone/menaquinone biosynthesis methyltransferase [Bryobacterales bacterium]|nr:ubiquinone/menaquinone biosynthesis methyltransferase [Bryobacterales bacterium]
MGIPIERRELSRMSEMFGVIAPRYDLITRLFSYGMDRRWKRLGVERANLPENPVILDLASGTGDFSKIVRSRQPGAKPIATDLTHGMLRLARDTGVEHAVCADAMRLPFPDESFDCVFVGYGLRNFPDLPGAVAEIERVTKPGGKLVSLDFFLPENPVLRKIYLGYLFVQGGLWGLILHGRPRIYTYIPDSIRSFLSQRELCRLLEQKGYATVDTRGFIFGGIALHWAAKG